MDLLIGHQPLKIILISFAFVMLNGEILRVQPVTLPTFTIPPNVSTDDLIAANKIKIIGDNIIEKEDKDIIRIQTILPKFNSTSNKRMKIRNPMVNSNSEIVNVVKVLQSNIITTSPLPFTITKRSPQIYSIPDGLQKNSFINNLIPTTSIPKKVGPYLYERPTGQPFEYETQFVADQTDFQTTIKRKYLYEKPIGNQFDVEDRFGQDYDQSKIDPNLNDVRTGAPSEIQPIISQKNQTEKPILMDVKPAFVSISGGNGKFDIRTLRVLKPKKRKHRKKNKNRKMDKNILENEIVKIKVN